MRNALKKWLVILATGISTVCSAQRRTWEFAVTLSSETSAANYVKIYVDADNPDLGAPLTGFFVRVGHAGKNLALYRQSGTLDSLLVEGASGRLSAGSRVRFKVERDPDGTWSLSADYRQSGDYVPEGRGTDTRPLSGGYAGVVKICSLPDPQPADELSVERILPPAPAYPAQPGEVIVSEIMADPEPVVGLPACEYVELYNRTEHDISLDHWTFSYGSTVKTISGVTIPAGDYLLLAHAEAVPLLSPYGTTVALFTSRTSLANEGQSLVLKDAAGMEIHAVAYAKSWYGGSARAEGGWSIEMKDTDRPSGDGANWLASADPAGGTPGRPNSHTVTVFPGEKQIFAISLSAEVFTPDGDGNKDMMEAVYRAEKAGYSAEAVIYTTGGQAVRQLYNNEPLPAEGRLTWDGRNAGGSLMPAGAYILYVRFHHPEGNVREYKWPVVLSLP